tara:strand:+ start:1045 stop:1281 length:237 start_codon:yes stop_codon:yes gene_type:complete
MRELTANERAVLAHIVVDPDEWWTNANSVVKIDHEAALGAKVGRYQSDYDDAAALDGYKTRAERDAADAAERAALESA